MKYGLLQLLILLVAAGSLPVQATSRLSSVSPDTTVYGYRTGDNDTLVPPKKNRKKWNIFGLKIPAYIPPKRMDRGIVKPLFIPKKTWQLGFSVSHYQENNDDYDFLIIEDWKGRAYSFRISPFFCWYFKDNWSIGGRFTYKNTRFQVDQLKISLEDDMSFELNNVRIKNNMYQSAVFVRNYVGLHPRIGLFNETHLTYGYGKGWLSTGDPELPKHTYQTTHELQLGIRPGICGFVTNAVMFEFSFEVGGLRYRKITQTTNGEEKGSRTTGMANFRLNLLSLNLGLAVCI